MFSIPNCDHKFCKECIKEYVKNSVSSGKVLVINCP